MQDNVLLKIDPRHIDMLTKLMEAYEYLGVVTTLDRSQGLVIIRGTVDTYPELVKILPRMPFPLEIL